MTGNLFSQVEVFKKFLPTPFVRGLCKYVSISIFIGKSNCRIICIVVIAVARKSLKKNPNFYNIVNKLRRYGYVI